MIEFVLLAVATAEAELDGTNLSLAQEVEANQYEEIDQTVEKVGQRDTQDFTAIDIEKDEEILL